MRFALLALCALTPSALPPSAAPSQPAPSNVEGAVIRNSGSTNTQPYTIAITADGNAVVTVGSGTPEVHRLPAGQAAVLFDELRAAAPLDALAHGHCMRSASFGTTTTVTFGGATTPDLSCAPGPGAQDLAKTVSEISRELRIPVRRIYPPAPAQ